MRKGMIFIGLCLLAVSALAQGTAGTVELTPTAGYWFGDTFTKGSINGINVDLRIDDAPAYGVRIAYKVTDTFAIDGLLVHSRADLSTGQGALFGGRDKVGNMDLNTGEIGLEAAFGHKRFVPFIGTSVGAMNMDPDLAGLSSETRFVAALGAGFKLFFTPQVALRFDWRAHAVSVNDNSHHRHDNCDHNWDCGGDSSWLTFREVALGLTFAF
jgi:hypothetical protein